MRPSLAHPESWKAPQDFQGEKSVPSRNDVFTGLMLACESAGVEIGHRRLGRLVKRYQEDAASRQLDYAVWLRHHLDPTGELAVERIGGGADAA